MAGRHAERTVSEKENNKELRQWGAVRAECMGGASPVTRKGRKKRRRSPPGRHGLYGTYQKRLRRELYH